MSAMFDEWRGTMPLKTLIEKSIPPAKWLTLEVAPRTGRYKQEPPVRRVIKHETAMTLAFKRAVSK